MKKILIVTPSLNRVGGVANHYLGLKNHWQNKIIYEFYGQRNGIPAIFLFGFDILKYFFKLIFFKPDVIILNPSLRKYQLFRDGIYLRIANLLNVKVITFFHGWDTIKANHFISNPKKFKKVFDGSLFIYVLCKDFRNQLLKIGFKTPIMLTTTKVATDLLTEFRIDSRTGSIKNILFLGRIEENKGIFVALESFKDLQREYAHLNLRVVGSGSALGEAKLFVRDNKIDNVTFTGPLFGKKIAFEYIKADLYILPTTHGEGMPTSVLEAMAFGLPVISRPVGGIVDFFLEGKMGSLIDSVDPNDYTSSVKKLLENRRKVKEISLQNHEFSTKHFLADRVAKKIEADISTFIK